MYFAFIGAYDLLEFSDGHATAAFFGGCGVVPCYEWVFGEELEDSAFEDAGAFAMNDAYPGATCDGGIVEVAVKLVEGVANGYHAEMNLGGYRDLPHEAGARVCGFFRFVPLHLMAQMAVSPHCRSRVITQIRENSAGVSASAIH